MQNSKYMPVEDTNSSPEVMVKKRRSSVFRRESIVFTNKDIDNSNQTETCSKSKISKLDDAEECKPFDIEKYMENLNAESKKWKEVYQSRKSLVKDLKKQMKDQEEFEQSLDLNLLSDFEKEFLAAKPDYDGFCKSVFKLQAMATKVGYLNMCAENCYENTLLKLKEETDNVVDRIIKIAD